MPQHDGDAPVASPQLLAEIDAHPGGDSDDEIDQRLRNAVDRSLNGLVGALPRSKAASQKGCLVVNPHSFVRRIGIQVPELDTLPKIERPVYSAAAGKDTNYLVVDVPPMGFVWASVGYSP